MLEILCFQRDQKFIIMYDSFSTARFLLLRTRSNFDISSQIVPLDVVENQFIFCIIK